MNAVPNMSGAPSLGSSSLPLPPSFSDAWAGSLRDDLHSIFSGSTHFLQQHNVSSDPTDFVPPPIPSFQTVPRRTAAQNRPPRTAVQERAVSPPPRTAAQGIAVPPPPRTAA